MPARQELPPEAACIGCECTDSRACHPIQCGWERVDRELRLGVCSNCEPLAGPWDRAMKKYIADGGDFIKFLNNEIH